MVIWRPRALENRSDVVEMDYQSRKFRLALKTRLETAFFTIFANFSQFFLENNNFISDVQFKYILALVNMAATVSYSCYNAESRFQVCPLLIPGPSGMVRPSLFQPNPEPYWVNIVPSSNEIFTLKVTPGSDLIDHMDRGQPGVKWPSREGFGSSNRKWAQIFSRSFPQTENFIQPNYKLYKFLNYEQFMTWWFLSVWELYYYS